jgi:hypothetical protein
MTTTSNGNAPSTAATASIGESSSTSYTAYLNPSTLVSEARFEEMVLEAMRKALHRLSIAQLENVLEIRRREESI